MKKFPLVIFIIVGSWLLTAARVHAQQSQVAPSRGAIELSLQEAKQRTLANYEKIKISQTEVEATKGSKWQSYRAALPSIQGGYQYTHNLKKPKLFLETGQVPVGADNSHSFNVTLSQPITRFGGIYHGIRASRLSYEASLFSQAQTQADVIFEASEAYFRVLLQRGHILAAQLSQEQAREVLRREEARFRVGEIPEFDYRRAALEYENKQADLLQVQGDYQSAIKALQRITGIPFEQEIRLVDSMEDFAKPIPEQKILEKFADSNPRIQALSRTAASAEQNRKATRAGFFPSVQFSASYQGSGQSTGRFLPKSRDFSNSGSVGVGMEIPIFDGMATIGAYKTAEAQAQRAAWEKELTAKDLRLALEQALIAAKTQAARQKNDLQSLKLAERLYEQAQLRFRNGLISFIDLKDVQNQLEQARLRYLNSLYNYVIQRAKVSQLVGSDIEYE